jgi:hypothetical protein
MLVMRGEKLWLESPELRESKGRYRVNSWQCSYVSPNNMSSEAWTAILSAIGEG